MKIDLYTGQWCCSRPTVR